MTRHRWLTPVNDKVSNVFDAEDQQCNRQGRNAQEYQHPQTALPRDAEQMYLTRFGKRRILWDQTRHE